MITPFFIGFEVRFQEIRKKEKLQNQEDNHQLDDNNGPELFTNGHILKTLVIKEENIGKKSFHSGLGVFDPASSTYFQVPSGCFFQMEI